MKRRRSVKVRTKANLPSREQARRMLKDGFTTIKSSNGRVIKHKLTAAQRKLFGVIASGRRPKVATNPPDSEDRDVIIYDQVGGLWARKGQRHACDRKCLEADHWYEHVFTEKFALIGRPDGKLEI